MAKQRDAGDLRDSVRSAAFTPSVRDVDGVVLLLGDADAEVAVAAERALVAAFAGRSPGLVPRIVERLTGATPETKAAGFRVLGRMAPKERVVAEVLVLGLSDGDPRIARAAAHAVGRLRDSDAGVEIGDALLRAWDAVPELSTAKALAEAMGKLGVTASIGRLEAVTGGDRELARVAQKALAMLARDGSRGAESEIRGDVVGDFEARVVFTCRAGLEGTVASEITEKLPGAGAVTRGDGRVEVLFRGAPNDLFRVRTALGFAFALPPERLTSSAALVTACVRALTSDAARRILETWTQGTVRYRLGWDGTGRGRGTTWRVVQAMTEEAPQGWVNDPTASTWDITLRVFGDSLQPLLAPRKLHDPRFTYRIADVPAASHPTVAAALVRESAPSASDVVWDPFVGSASELVERARAGPYRSLLGSDLAESALAAARTNLAAAQLDGVVLEQADATVHSPRGVTRIITNPPMGRRVARDGSLAVLLDQFLDHAANVLVPKGRLVWLSPLAGRTAARAEANGLRVTLRQTVDMGGFHAELQVMEKP